MNRPEKDVKIRARLTADADMLAVLADVGNRFHSNAMPHLFREPPSGDFGSQPPGGSESEILVAEIEEKVIAFVDVCIQHMAETDVTVQRDVGVVNRIVVAEEYRNQGVARALMNAAANWLRTRGCMTLELNVFEFNLAAQRLYESLGYTTILRRLGLKL